jgi:hypothetical protein
VKRAALVVAALAAAAIAVVLVTGGGGSGEGGSGTTTAKPPAAPPGRAPARPGREPVRRGQDGTPDRPAPGTGPLLGISDQKAETFKDPRFKALRVTRTRLSTPWSSIFTEPGRLAAWLNAARADGLEPLVAFEHARSDRCPAAPCTPPSVADYERAVRAFHARYPWVTLLQPWNEANSATQPTGTRPELAAAYYEAVKRVCPNCTVPAADVLDANNLARWLRRFKAALHGPVPRLWGLHNYGDTNRFRDTGTRHLLSLVPGVVWITESGGIVSFTTAGGRQALPYDEQRAARATSYLFQLAGEFPRIQRIYIYQWKIDFPGNRFDAGLLAPDGKPRPAFAVLERKRALMR